MLGSVDPGPIGVLVGHRLSAENLRIYARRAEELGFGACWFGEGLGREAFSQASLLLAATERMAVGTSIANLHARDAVAMRNAAWTLAEAWPHRFLVGIGVSHAPYVVSRGHRYGGALTDSSRYLDAMEAAPAYTAPAPAQEPPLLLAALGPRMLALARDRAAGAISFLVDPAGARRARSILGPAAFHSVIAPTALASTRARAREIGGPILVQHLRMPNYRANLLRLGWAESDLEGEGSDALFDAVIQWGDPAGIAGRLEEFRAAGVDHVAVNVCSETQAEPPLRELEQLAERLVA
jgi:probable F420-dependent oxidoreductase